jgi:hypothetical protein
MGCGQPGECVSDHTHKVDSKLAGHGMVLSYHRKLTGQKLEWNIAGAKAMRFLKTPADGAILHQLVSVC